MRQQELNNEFITQLGQLAKALDANAILAFNDEIAKLSSKLTLLEKEPLPSLESLYQVKPTNTTTQAQSFWTNERQNYVKMSLGALATGGIVYIGYQNWENINITPPALNELNKLKTAWQGNHDRNDDLNRQIQKLEQQKHSLEQSKPYRENKEISDTERQKKIEEEIEEIDQQINKLQSHKGMSKVNIVDIARSGLGLIRTLTSNVGSSDTSGVSGRGIAAFLAAGGIGLASYALYKNYYANKHRVSKFNYSVVLNPLYQSSAQFSLCKKHLGLLTEFKAKISAMTSTKNPNTEINAIKQLIDMYINIYSQRRVQESIFGLSILNNPIYTMEVGSEASIYSKLREASEASTILVPATMQNTTQLLVGGVYVNKVKNSLGNATIKTNLISQDNNIDNLEALKRAHKTLTQVNITNEKEIRTNIARANNDAKKTCEKIKDNLEKINNDPNSRREIKDLIANYFNHSIVINGLDQCVAQNLMPKTLETLKKLITQKTNTQQLGLEINKALDTKSVFSSQSSRLEKLGQAYRNKDRKIYEFCIKLSKQQYIKKHPITKYAFGPIKKLLLLPITTAIYSVKAVANIPSKIKNIFPNKKHNVQDNGITFTAQSKIELDPKNLKIKNKTDNDITINQNESLIEFSHNTCNKNYTYSDNSSKATCDISQQSQTNSDTISKSTQEQRRQAIPPIKSRSSIIPQKSSSHIDTLQKKKLEDEQSKDEIQQRGIN